MNRVKIFRHIVTGEVATANTSSVAAVLAASESWVEIEPPPVDGTELDVQKILAAKQNKTDPVRSSFFPYSKPAKACITFVDDDGHKNFLSKWLPLMQSKNFGMSVAVVTDWVGRGANDMDWDDLRAIRSAGVDIVCHSKTHDNNMSTWTEDQVVAEFEEARSLMAAQGIESNVLAYPGGTGDFAHVRSAAKHVFDAAIISGGNIPNRIPITNSYIYRYALDTNATPTLTFFKSVVDEAKRSNGWAVFMSHSQNTTLDAAMLNVVSDLIDYARSNEVEIVTVREGLQMFANSFEGHGGGKIAPNGGFVGNGVWGGVLDVDTNFARFVGDYAIGITNERINAGNAKLFPKSQAGLLVTTKTIDATWQDFLPYQQNEVHRRKLSSSGAPGTFKLQTPTSFSTALRPLDVDAGYCGFDTTLDKPIWCKTAGVRHVLRIDFLTGADTDGTFTLGGATVPVTAGMTPGQIAAAFEAATYAGWSLIIHKNTSTVYMYRLANLSASTPTFADGGTGVSCSMTVERTGSAAIWVDATGAVV